MSKHTKRMINIVEGGKSYPIEFQEFKKNYSKASVQSQQVLKSSLLQNNQLTVAEFGNFFSLLGHGMIQQEAVQQFFQNRSEPLEIADVVKVLSILGHQRYNHDRFVVSQIQEIFKKFEPAQTGIVSPPINIAPSFQNFEKMLILFPNNSESRELVQWWLRQKDVITAAPLRAGETNLHNLNASDLQKLQNILGGSELTKEWFKLKANKYEALANNKKYFGSKNTFDFVHTIKAAGIGADRIADLCSDFYPNNTEAKARFLSQCCNEGFVKRDEPSFQGLVKQFKAELEVAHDAEALLALQEALDPKDRKIPDASVNRLLQKRAYVTRSEEEYNFSASRGLPLMEPLHKHLQDVTEIDTKALKFKINFENSTIDRERQKEANDVLRDLLSRSLPDHSHQEDGRRMMYLFAILFNRDGQDKRADSRLEYTMYDIFRHYKVQIAYLLEQKGGIEKLEHIIQSPDQKKVVSDLCFAAAEAVIKNRNGAMPNPLDEILLHTFQHDIFEPVTSRDFSGIGVDRMKDFNPLNAAFSSDLRISPKGLVQAMDNAVIAFDTKHAARFRQLDFLVAHIANDGRGKKKPAELQDITRKTHENVDLVLGRRDAASSAVASSGNKQITVRELITYFALKEAVPSLLANSAELKPFVAKCEEAITAINPHYKKKDSAAHSSLQPRSGVAVVDPSQNKGSWLC